MAQYFADLAKEAGMPEKLAYYLDVDAMIRDEASSGYLTLVGVDGRKYWGDAILMLVFKYLRKEVRNMDEKRVEELDAKIKKLDHLVYRLFRREERPANKAHAKLSSRSKKENLPF